MAQPIHILLVEDNEGDIFLITEALNEGKILNRISVVQDGEEAMLFLEQKGIFADAELPDLILLDINLPRKNGHEVLKQIKNSIKLQTIPVIVLTTSSSPQDISHSYKNHANCYITKPVAAEEFLQVVTSIENFWISIVTLPSAT